MNAQSELRNDYSIHDPCSDPKKNHIASRKIYTEQVGETVKTIHVDTVFEKYDRNGNLLALNYFEAGITHQDSYWIKHEFSYDVKGKIIREETQFPGEGWRVTYSYNTEGDSILAHYTRSHVTHEIMYTLIYYSKFDTTEYGLDYNGDTIRFVNATKNKRTIVSWQRDAENNKVVTDCTITITHPGKITAITWFLNRTGQIVTLEEVRLLNKKGYVTDKLFYLENHNLRDSIHYTYDNRGQRILTTSTIYPAIEYSYDTTITHWQTKYLYDKEGRLVQIHETNATRPYLRFVTSFIYNERGLLTEIHKVDLNYGHIVDEEHERWIYTYY